MTLQEAIKILSHKTFAKGNVWVVSEERARKLGIEALKRLEEWRKGTVLNPDYLLPGETEE